MTPSELACSWYGHELMELTFRTPRLGAGLGDSKFTISQTCSRCGGVWEQKITGGLAYLACEEYEHGLLDIRLA